MASKRVITTHRDFFWPGNKELRSQHENDKLWINVHDQTTGEHVYIKFTVNTDDVNGFAKHYNTNLKEKQKLLAEILNIADNLPIQISLDWLKSQGFDWD